MGTFVTKKIKLAGRYEDIKAERFECSADVVRDSANRKIIDSRYEDKRRGCYNSGWSGVRDWKEVEKYMIEGYAPNVEKLNTAPSKLQGQGKRVTFRNNVVGYVPVVPLYLQGVPNCMIDTHVKVIKSRVLNIYYDMTVNCNVTTEQIMKAGQNLLAAILELELQGYKFNLYSTQPYYRPGEGADILCVKIKNSSTPLNIKRMAFPLTHPAFFRGVGFDWVSRFPIGHYRHDYGTAMEGYVNEDDMARMYEELFHEKCVVFTCAKAYKQDKEYFKKKLMEKGGK